MRKALPWLALIIAALWLVNDPAGAAAHHPASCSPTSTTFAHGL